MSIGKDMVIERLRSAMSAAVGEVRKDPEFLGKVVSTICKEFGLDSMTALLIAGKLKHAVRKTGDAE